MNTIFFLTYSLLLWALCVFDIIKASKDLRKIVAYAIILSFSFYAAMRGMDVSDTMPYAEYFQAIRSEIFTEGFFAINGRFEIGYEFLTKTIALFTNNTKVYFFLIAIINISLAYNIFSDRNYVIIPLVVYISFFGFYFGFVILRAGISILCFCYGVLKCRKNIIRLLISFAFAFVFHNSAIVAIVFYFLGRIGNKNIPFGVAFSIIIVSFAMYVSELFLKLMSTEIIHFLESISSSNKIWIKGLGFLKELVPTGQILISKRFVFNIIIYLGTKIVISRSPTLKKERNLQIIDRLLILSFIMIGLFGNGTLIGRLSDYLFIFNIVYIKLTFKEYQKYKYNISIKNNALIDSGQGAGVIMMVLLCIVLLNITFAHRLLIIPV